MLEIYLIILADLLTTIIAALMAVKCIDLFHRWNARRRSRRPNIA